MKACNYCNQVKPFTEYYKHRLARDGYEPRCKACKIEVARVQRRAWKIQAIAEKGGRCSICEGVFPPCAYDFHHRDSDKEVSPGNARSKKLFFSEIEKCDLVCANCHRVLHHSDPFLSCSTVSQ